MKLRSVGITNIRGFWTDIDVALDPAVTTILGKNNAGKTALLNTICAPGGAQRHRGPASIPIVGSANTADSQVRYEFELEKADIAEITHGEFSMAIAGPAVNAQAALAQLESVRKRDRLTVKASVTTYSNGQSAVLCVPDYLARAQDLNGCCVFRFRPNAGSPGGVDITDARNAGWQPPPGFLSPELGHVAFEQYLLRRMFRFAAERRPALAMTIEPYRELAVDAANLVNVLDALRSEKARFAYFEESVRRLIPELGEIRLPTIGSGQKSIRICFGESIDRTDLTFGLDELGTGTTQALALVYAITTSEHPRTILLDEPSTFLHPGAARELLRLAARHREHQYIIASHSPLVLEEFPSARLILLERATQGFTIRREADADSIEGQRAVLDQLGVSAADVFGADNVLWVEGPTERAVYAEIARNVRWVPRGTVLFPLVATGDLSGRNEQLAFELYRRLTNGIGLSPRRMAFLLDRENRTASQIAELQRLTGNTVHLTPGRMLENSFMSPTLVAAFLTRHAHLWGGPPVEPNDVELAWNAMSGVKRYCTDTQRATNEIRWSDEVHAARVLEDTATKLSDSRFDYRKASHGLELTRLAFELQLESVTNPLIHLMRSALGL